MGLALWMWEEAAQQEIYRSREEAVRKYIREYLFIPY
jgi:metal-responsive CopG/Arc/MetJ family transcriptional regulator